MDEYKPVYKCLTKEMGDATLGTIILAFSLPDSFSH
jgi:hypothetical protein